MHISCTFAHVRIRADLLKMPTSLNEPALLPTDTAYLHLPSSLFASADLSTCPTFSTKGGFQLPRANIVNKIALCLPEWSNPTTVLRLCYVVLSLGL